MEAVHGGVVEQGDEGCGEKGGRRKASEVASEKKKGYVVLRPADDRG